MFNSILLSNFIEKDPGFIVGPISNFLGVFINIIFNMVYSITTSNSLGFTIILFTIFIRIIMLPLNYKQQKSMFMMQKIQPEMKAIQDKYKDTKDPNETRKMQVEITQLYAKYNYNPFSGCLPVFVQLPLFIALFFIMKNSYIYISALNNVYAEIGMQLMADPNFADITSIVAGLVPSGMSIDISIMSDLQKIINKLTPEHWVLIQETLPSVDIIELLDLKNSIQTFGVFNLSEVIGMRFPEFILVILSAGTTFLSSWLAMRSSTSTDPNIIMQQKVMNVLMPLMMGWFTVSMPCGVAFYWIIGNIIQMIQQVFLTKYCKKKFAES